MMKKRLAALVLSIVFAVGLAPTVALAADGGDLAVGSMLTTQDATSYDLWVGGVEVTSANATNVTGEGISGKVSYDAATNTLTLNGASITGEGVEGELSWDDASSSFTLNGAKFSGLHEVKSYYYKDGESVPYLETYDCCIYQKSNKALTVKLVGINKLNISNDRQRTYAFRKVGGSLVFAGGGSLSVALDCSYGCTAISCADLVVNAGTTVSVKASSPSAWCEAVQSSGNIAVNGSLISTATGDSDVYAVFCDKAVTVKGKLIAHATSNEDLARGVYAENGGLTVAKGGSLVAEADSKGPYNDDDGTAISIYSGTFTLDGSVKATAKSCGVDGDADHGVSLKVGSAGNLIASGEKGALREISLKLASSSLKVKAGDSSKTAKVTVASKIGDAKYVHIYAAKANPITAKAKTVTFKASKVKKKAQSVKASKAFTVKKAQGKVTYKKTSGSKKIAVSKAGKVTVKKGTKKGTYKAKVKVTAAGNATYKSGSKTVTLKVKVK